MRNSAFKEATQILDPPRGRTDVAPLQVHFDGQVVTSCWRMSWRERWSALLFGTVWVRIPDARGRHPPIALDSVRRLFK